MLGVNDDAARLDKLPCRDEENIELWLPVVSDKEGGEFVPMLFGVEFSTVD